MNRLVEILKFERGAVDKVLYRAKNAVLDEKILIYPTDTVYGIGGDAFNSNVVNKIKKIKGIDESKPLSVMMSDIKMIEEYCEVGLWEEMILKKYLPGPFTFILKKKIDLPVSLGGTIGVRVPEFEFCNRLSEEVEKPIVSTSANKTGESAPVNFEEINKEVLESADIAIDRGQTRYQRSSDVIDLVHKKIIRKGVGVINLDMFPEK